MNVAALSPTTLARRLSHPGLRLRTGPFVFSVRSTLPRFAADFRLLYGDFPLAGEDQLADFHVSLTRPAGPRRWLYPQSLFVLGDRTTPFDPYPLAMALPMFEWGLNWCVWDHAHQYLIIHAAVVERHGQALILSAPSGSGKSTLCAGLVQRGWRLLSDELALVRPQDGRLAPLPRPICLKNESIRLVRQFAPRAVLGPVCRATRKGTVAHVRPPPDSVARAQETAPPAWVVFPRHRAGAAASLTPVPRGRAFLRLADYAFNYSLLGVKGFETLAGLIDASSCYDFCYGDLEEAVALLKTLAPSPALAHAAPSDS
jgi:HprK-related kinase A